MAQTEHPSADDYRNRAERAEAECAELRGRLAEPTPEMIEAGAECLYRLFGDGVDVKPALVVAAMADVWRAMQGAAK